MNNKRMMGTAFVAVFVVFCFNFIVAEAQNPIINEGDVLTQQQIDDLNTELLTIETLQCNRDSTDMRMGINFYDSEYKLFYPFECLYILPNNDGSGLYSVVWIETYSEFKIADFESCITTSDIEPCVTEYKSILLSQANEFVTTSKNMVNNYKTSSAERPTVSHFNVDIFGT